MKTSILFLATLVALLKSEPARAADFDGSKPFICSVIRVVVCPREGEVEKETAESVNLAQFLFVDVQKKIVTGKGPSGDTRQTTIENIRHDNGTMILEGVQLGKAWHAVINEQTGKTTLTGATEDVAFVVFAACTLNQGSTL